MNGKTIAESNDTIVVEGNHYVSSNDRIPLSMLTTPQFPPSSVNRDVFTDSKTHTHCGWKVRSVIEGTLFMLRMKALMPQRSLTCSPRSLPILNVHV